MAKRASLPLIICLIAAGAALFGLTRTASSPEPANAASSVAAESSTDDNSTAAEDGAAPPAASAAAITIADFAFGGDLVVQPGQTVQVDNVDGAPHTLTSTDGAFDTGTIGGGGSGSFVAPSAPGTYSFFCALHPSMTGTLTVAA